jgi:ethylbenzene dioxygenase beta subunit
MPGVQTRYRADKAPRISPTRMAFFDDDMLNLRRRVTRSLNETAWAEDPPTRTCYMVSNVQARRASDAASGREEFDVASGVLTCRGRNETEENWLSARRQDRLRRGEDGALYLARREIYITESVLLAKNLNIFL